MRVLVSTCRASSLFCARVPASCAVSMRGRVCHGATAASPALFFRQPTHAHTSAVVVVLCSWLHAPPAAGTPSWVLPRGAHHTGRRSAHTHRPPSCCAPMSCWPRGFSDITRVVAVRWGRGHRACVGHVCCSLQPGGRSGFAIQLLARSVVCVCEQPCTHTRHLLGCG
jgi:hypothetical protein